MTVYNDTFMNSAVNVVDLMTGLSTSMGNDYLIGYLLMIGIFVIILVISHRLDWKEVLIVDGFLTTIIGILFYVVGLVPVTAIVIPAIIMFISIVWHYLSG